MVKRMVNSSYNTTESRVTHFNFTNGNSTSENSSAVHEPVRRQGLLTHAETHTLFINDLEAADFGAYKVKVKNAAGTAESLVNLRRAPGKYTARI